jgi:hypothetical protein
MGLFGVRGYANYYLITDRRLNPLMGLSWNVTDGVLDMAMKSFYTGYVAIGFASKRGKMINADTVIGVSGDAVATSTKAYYMPSYTARTIERAIKSSGYLLETDTLVEDGCGAHICMHNHYTRSHKRGSTAAFTLIAPCPSSSSRMSPLRRFITSRFTRAMGARPGTDDIKLDATGDQELIWAYRKKYASQPLLPAIVITTSVLPHVPLACEVII